MHLEVRIVQNLDEDLPGVWGLRIHVGMVGCAKAQHKHQEDQEEKHQICQLEYRAKSCECKVRFLKKKSNTVKSDVIRVKYCLYHKNKEKSYIFFPHSTNSSTDTLYFFCKNIKVVRSDR